MAKYKNPFYSPKNSDSKPVIETDAKPVQYKGYLIYERIKGVCVGMYAGINGAKQAIDNKKI